VAFAALDHWLWHRLHSWARRQHQRKNRRWVARRYFGRHHPSRNDKWVFGDPKTGAYLHRYSWTPIVRHVPVAGRSSPDDPALTRYWANRRSRHNRRHPPLAPTTGRALRTQTGRCAHCGDFLLHTGDPPNSPHQWETWFRAARTAITHTAIPVPDAPDRAGDRHHLVHASCHRRHPAGDTADTNSNL
jgi:RNA-directed DNA polymerase